MAAHARAVLDRQAVIGRMSERAMKVVKVFFRCASLHQRINESSGRLD